MAMTALAVTANLGLAGCATWTNKEKGAVIGAAGGAAAGAAVGKATGNVARGAIIGAVLGGAAGAVIGHQMDQQKKEIERSVAGATVTRVGEGLVVTFESGLLFDYDRAELRQEARDNLAALAESLKRYPNENVMIIGHADATGSDSYNLDLSQRRSRSAASYLMAQGVDASRVVTRGMGESDPVASNDTEDGRQANRRIEVALYANEAWRRQAQQQVSSRQ
jgi:outer membrane protein OmpA-like peptidoglycan-associated protein